MKFTTVDMARLEPGSTGDEALEHVAFSIAVSLKRIADALDQMNAHADVRTNAIEAAIRNGISRSAA
jgi:hypothetical protein